MKHFFEQHADSSENTISTFDRLIIIGQQCLHRLWLLRSGRSGRRRQREGLGDDFGKGTGLLGMASISSRFSEFERLENRAVGHVLVCGFFHPKFQRQPDAQSAAGGVSSSANGLTRWMAMLLANGPPNIRTAAASSPSFAAEWSVRADPPLNWDFDHKRLEQRWNGAMQRLLGY